MSRHSRPGVILGSAVTMATLVAWTVTQATGGNAGLAPSARPGDEDWPSYGRLADENHYSPLTQINPGNSARLHLAWTFDLDTSLRADSQPLEVNGVVFAAAGLSVVYALDAISGQLLWRFDPHLGAPEAHFKARATWGIRGLAYLEGRIFVGTHDGRLIALDAHSGKLVWSVSTLDPDDETTITGAPRAFAGKVFIGFAGGDRQAVRGALNCYDAGSGEILWKFYTVPGRPGTDDGAASDSAMARAAKTWSGNWWKFGGGGTVWNAITYDPDFNRIYIGTGNALPWNWKIRNPTKRDNLFTASIVALDADSGQYVWHYQNTPNDSWDYDSTADISLTTLRIDGRTRPVLMQANKNGFFYVIDRSSGVLLSAKKYEKATWAQKIDLTHGRPVLSTNARYERGPVMTWPGDTGAHSWSPMSYSPITRLVYIPAIHMGELYGTQGVAPKSWQPTPNTWNNGLAHYDPEHLDRSEFGSALAAWDPVKQTIAWQVRTAGTWPAGVLTTGGGLVFQGHIDGNLSAYDARSGERVWSFNAGVSIMGAPIAYAVAGREYVSVMSGPTTLSSSSENLRFRGSYTAPRRILTFALDGQAQLPDDIVARPSPLAERSNDVQPAVAKRGETLFALNCAVCHGDRAVSGGVAPDLRNSAIVPQMTGFSSVVSHGLLATRGMPMFDELASDDLVALQAYLLGAAHDRPR